MPSRVFFLSPARCDGKRAQVLIRDAAAFPLARRIRIQPGAPLGEVFSFLSGLYFRGKIAYARHFAENAEYVHVITTNRGLLSPDTVIRVRDLSAFGCVDIANGDDAFREPIASRAPC